MIETLRSGGIVMVPLAACSVLALAVIIERLWGMRRSRVITPEIIGQVSHWIGQGLVEEAVALCRRVDSPMANVIMAGLRSSKLPRAEMRLALEDAGRQEAAGLDRNLNWLSICATVAPLIGLLGTVTGMIKVFRVVAVEGPGDPFALSSGISEALITTAAGLTVAIPSLLFYHYFAGRADSMASEMERHSMQVMGLLDGHRGAGGGGQ